METRAERAPKTQLQVTAVDSERQGSRMLPALCNRTAEVSVFYQQYNYYPKSADRHSVQRLPVPVHIQGDSRRKLILSEVRVSVIMNNFITNVSNAEWLPRYRCLNLARAVRPIPRQ
jgi:hypothetical protein